MKNTTMRLLVLSGLFIASAWAQAETKWEVLNAPLNDAEVEIDPGLGDATYRVALDFSDPLNENIHGQIAVNFESENGNLVTKMTSVSLYDGSKSKECGDRNCVEVYRYIKNGDEALNYFAHDDRKGTSLLLTSPLNWVQDDTNPLKMAEVQVRFEKQSSGGWDVMLGIRRLVVKNVEDGPEPADLLGVVHKSVQ